MLFIEIYFYFVIFQVVQLKLQMQLQSINNNSLILYFCTVNNIIREIEMNFYKILTEMGISELTKDELWILVKTCSKLANKQPIWS
jgi:hypothetical protein